MWLWLDKSPKCKPKYCNSFLLQKKRKWKSIFQKRVWEKTLVGFVALIIQVGRFKRSHEQLPFQAFPVTFLSASGIPNFSFLVSTHPVFLFSLSLHTICPLPLWRVYHTILICLFAFFLLLFMFSFSIDSIFNTPFPIFFNFYGISFAIFFSTLRACFVTDLCLVLIDILLTNTLF